MNKIEIIKIKGDLYKTKMEMLKMEADADTRWLNEEQQKDFRNLLKEIDIILEATNQ